MRYTDEELFAEYYEQYRFLLNSTVLTPRNFMQWCADTMNKLIIESVEADNWLDAEANHLRNYRAKAMKFYTIKSGGKDE